MEERNGLEVSFQRELCFSLSIPASNLNWSRRCRVQGRAPLLPLLERKKLSQITAARNCHHHCRHCLFGYQWFLALLMAETAKTMVRWSMSLINLHRRYLERRPASPLVPSRHMKLSLDDLKALQEHIKDLLILEDLKKITGGVATNMIDVFAMKLSTPSSSWSALFPLAFHFCLRMSLRNKLCFQSLSRGHQNVFLAAASRAKHRHIDRRLPLYRHCCQVRATLALPHLCWHLWSYTCYARFCSQNNFCVD